MNSLHRKVKNKMKMKSGAAAFAFGTLAVLMFVTSSVPSQAQVPTPTIIYEFQQATTDSAAPWGAVAQGRDGNLYGTGTARRQFHGRRLQSHARGSRNSPRQLPHQLEPVRRPHPRHGRKLLWLLCARRRQQSGTHLQSNAHRSSYRHSRLHVGRRPGRKSY